MTYTQEITLDVNTLWPKPMVYTKQGDTNSRYLIIHLTRNGVPYLVGGGNLVSFRFIKPDKTEVLSEVDVQDDGSLSLLLSQQTLAVAGIGQADVMIYGENHSDLSTATFYINIQAKPDIDEDDIISTDEYSIFEDTVDNWVSKVTTATASAEVVDLTEDPEVNVINNTGLNFHFKIPAGDSIFSTFDVDYTNGCLYMYEPPLSSWPSDINFSINNNGELEVVFNGD